MFQYSSNLKITGGAFNNNNNCTLVSEQNGMTGALYESVVNWYILTSIYAKVSRYCIDGSLTAPPMILSIMHLYVTQIPARLSLVKSWAGLKTPLARLVSYGSMVQRARARRQLPSHSENYGWLLSGLLEAFSSRDMPLEEATPNFCSQRFLSGSPTPSLTSVRSSIRLSPTTHLSQRRH